MFKIVARVEFDVEEPDGGVTTEHETVDYDGDQFESIEEAKERLYEAMDLNPGLPLWIVERS